MTYSLRQMAPEDKDCQHIRLDLLEEIIPLHCIEAVLAQTQRRTQRQRKLDLISMVYFVIALNLFADHAYTHVYYKLSQALRFLRRQSCASQPTSHAFSARRAALGAQPLQVLFERCCQPMATAQTPGAYRFGRRLMALDSTGENVPDTPANAQAFGRPSSQYGPGGYPQVRGLYLMECGTHLIVAAQFTPWRPNERRRVPALLAALPQNVLLLWDAGFHSFELIRQVLARQAHVLERLPAWVPTPILTSLPDGSYLTLLHREQAKQQQQEPILMRVIEYTITDPSLVGYGQRHRLLTNLLDPHEAPAQELIALYHERWEIELAIDEIDTHQRLCRQTLRSKTPEGVRQELYGTLLGYYAVRALMLQAAESQQMDVDRLSFTHALRVLECALPEFQLVHHSEHAALRERLRDDLLHGQLPTRTLRSNPRVIKRKRSKFLLKRKQHRHPAQPQADHFAEVIAVVPALFLTSFGVPLPPLVDVKEEPVSCVLFN